MPRSFVLALVAGLFAVVPARGQRPGELDPSYDSPLESNAEVNSTILLADGKLLVGGSFRILNTVGQWAVARLNPDGSLDHTFPPIEANAPVLCMAIQGDGKAIIGGGFSEIGGVARTKLARLNSDGTVDTGFQAGDVLRGAVTAMAFQDQKIIAAGLTLFRIEPNGTNDTLFSAGFGSVERVAVQPDRKIVVAGRQFYIARRLQDGRADSLFSDSSTPDGKVETIVLQSDGRILVAGAFTSIFQTARNRIARLQPNGLLDPDFDPGSGGNGPVNAVVLQPDGRVLAGGAFSTFDRLPRGGVARLFPNGAIDAFDPGAGTNIMVRAMALQPDGRIIIAGKFETVQGLVRRGLARLFGGEIPTPPTITAHPQSQTVFEGDTVRFEVRASPPDVVYQWQFNGQDISSATNAVLTLNNVAFAQAGEYQVLIRNASGEAISDTGILTTRPFAPLTKWTLRQQGPTSAPAALGGLGGIAFGNGRYVIVGRYGTILTSADGQNWIQQPSKSNSLLDVAFGNGQFVAVGSGGTILSSPDGLSWTSRSSGSTAVWSHVQFANGMFFALSVGSSLVSDDGVNWKNGAVGFNRIAYGNGKYVAVDGSNVASVSADAVLWMAHDVGNTTSLNDVIFANDQFVAVGTGGVIVISRDGVSWTVATTGLGSALLSISYGSGTFVAVGGAVTLDSATSTVASSSDGMIWTRHTSATGSPIIDVVYGEGLFVGTATRPSGLGWISDIVVSTDGIHWRSVGNPAAWRSIIFQRDSFLAVGDNGRIVASSDGVTWSERNNPSTAHLRDVCFGSGMYVAVGGHGTIVSSDNGLDWTERTSNTQLDLSGVTYAAGRFVAVGGFRRMDLLSDTSRYVIVTSTDGIRWATADSKVNRGGLLDVAYGNGMFLGVGSMMFRAFPGDWTVSMLESPDGLTWTSFFAPVAPTGFGQVVYGRNRFVVDGGGIIAVMTAVENLRTWTQPAVGNPAELSGVGFGADTFLVLVPGAVLVSLDGNTWRRQETGYPVALTSVAFGKNTFVAVGENETILQSGAFPSDLRLENPVLQTGVFTVSVLTVIGKEYVLEFRNALEESTWTPLPAKAGNGSGMQFSDPAMASKQRFYRIRSR